MSTPSATNSATATFAGGCFWCTEAAFEQLAGVSDVTSGYAGGAAETANYEAVCRGDTGHAEAIRITYDPATDQLRDAAGRVLRRPRSHAAQSAGERRRHAVSLGDLLCRRAQRRAAEAKIAQLTAAKKFSRPIVTTLEPLAEFYPAEQYHQDYARHNPDQPYVASHSLPLACKVRAKHAGLMRKE